MIRRAARGSCTTARVLVCRPSHPPPPPESRSSQNQPRRPATRNSTQVDSSREWCGAALPWRPLSPLKPVRTRTVARPARTWQCGGQQRSRHSCASNKPALLDEQAGEWGLRGPLAPPRQPRGTGTRPARGVRRSRPCHPAPCVARHHASECRAPHPPPRRRHRALCACRSTSSLLHLCLLLLQLLMLHSSQWNCERRCVDS